MTSFWKKLIRSSLLILIGSVLVSFLTGCTTEGSGLLHPKGVVAFQERKLFFDTLALMLIVVLPVIIMSFTFVYHYQESHRVKDYKPNWSHSIFLESLWWGIPCAIIVILAVLTWKKTHQLDPYNPIPGHTEQPMRIQAIALPWKWLFIYPEQNIATVNYLVVPIGTQVEYWITADNVAMSAFFIPQLGSQIYAMAGMRTRLYLVANHTGTYVGMNTLYNGDGFTDMQFPVHVVEPEQMQQWVAQVKSTAEPLTMNVYTQLLEPQIKPPAAFYSGVEANLFENAIATYMHTFGKNHPRSKEPTMQGTMVHH